MEITQKDIWIRLCDDKTPYLIGGAMIRFRTLHTAGNGYKYAVATRIDGAQNLAFVGMDGGTWGYGRCTLPEDARYEGQPCTISRNWLLANFECIAEPQNEKDIWICHDALDVMEVYEAFRKINRG